MKNDKIQRQEKKRKPWPIPTCTEHHPRTHSRIPMEMIVHGRSMGLFQASQHSATGDCQVNFIRPGIYPSAPVQATNAPAHLHQQ